MLFLNRILRTARLAGGEAHTAVAVNTGKKGSTTVVTSVSGDERKLTDEELKQQQGDSLPDRTQMSVLRMPGDTLPVIPTDVD